MNRAESVLIRCALAGKGMFPSEVIVEIQTADAKVVTCLADAMLVSGDPPRIRATRLGVENDNISICLLPSAETDSGFRWVCVKDHDLLVARS